jgi:hypothetical protein
VRQAAILAGEMDDEIREVESSTGLLLHDLLKGSGVSDE